MNVVGAIAFDRALGNKTRNWNIKTVVPRRQAGVAQG